MRSSNCITTITYAILGSAAIISFILPSELTPKAAKATPAGATTIRLNGVVRDFAPTNTDFDATLQEASGHVSGLVASTIGEDGRPTFTGGGSVVTSQARDANGNNIAPVMASHKESVTFEIVNGQVIVAQPFAAKITVVGAAITSGNYDVPVTVKMNVGAAAINPFGDFIKAVAGNVNKAGNPRDYISPSIYAAKTPIFITGRSWLKKQSSYSGALESHWQTYLEFNTSSATKQVHVLRNGDLAPNTAGFKGQVAAKQFLFPYLDSLHKHVVLQANQVIYLFELGTTDMSSGAADFQDLVVVVTMASSLDAFLGTTVASGCGPDNDTLATVASKVTTAGIGSANSFKQWFSDSLGTNMSAAAPLDLVHDGSKFVFDDKTDARYSKLGGFYPADGRVLGSPDSSGHNENFSYSFETFFTYDQDISQYFETVANAEVWVFINDRLVIDMGGFHGMLKQRIDLSRLCLEDGKKYKLSFFMAHRYGDESRLRITTNLNLAGEVPITVLAPSD